MNKNGCLQLQLLFSLFYPSPFYNKHLPDVKILSAKAANTSWGRPLPVLLVFLLTLQDLGSFVLLTYPHCSRASYRTEPCAFWRDVWGRCPRVCRFRHE